MSELLEQLRKAVGENHVVAGQSVHDDYTHDEALTTVPVVPLAVVLPGSTGEVSEVLQAGQRAQRPGRGPRQWHGPLRRGGARWPTASCWPSTA